MKMIFTLAFITMLSVPGFSQADIKPEGITQSQNSIYNYAYILVEGKVFSKKLKVSVDFGDTPEQIEAGKQYSERLTNKKSCAAILNHMVDNQFELVSTLDYTESYSGSGGTSGVVFIMKKTRPNTGSK